MRGRGETRVGGLRAAHGIAEGGGAGHARGGVLDQGLPGGEGRGEAASGGGLVGRSGGPSQAPPVIGAAGVEALHGGVGRVEPGHALRSWALAARALAAAERWAATTVGSGFALGSELPRAQPPTPAAAIAATSTAPSTSGGAPGRRFARVPSGSRRVTGAAGARRTRGEGRVRAGAGSGRAAGAAPPAAAAAAALAGGGGGRRRAGRPHPSSTGASTARRRNRPDRAEPSVGRSIHAQRCPTSCMSAPADFGRSSGFSERAEFSTMSSSFGRSGRASVRRGGGSFSWACTAARLDLRPKGAEPARHA